MSIQQKLRFLAVITLTCLLLVMGLTAAMLSQLRQQFSSYQSQETLVASLTEIKATGLAVARLDPILPDTRIQLRAANQQILKLAERIAQHATEPREQARARQIKTGWQRYAQQFKQELDIAADNPADALSMPDAIYKAQLQPLIQEIDEWVKQQKNYRQQAENRVSGTLKHILWAVLIPLALASVLILFFQTGLNRNLRRRMRETHAAVEELQHGNLSRHLPDGEPDEIGEMATDVNRFVQQLASVLGETGRMAGNTRDTARAIRDMSDDVRQGSQAQLDRILQASAALEQMSGTIREVAQNAGSAANAARQASQLVASGSQAGQHTVAVLDRIHDAVNGASNTLRSLTSTLGQIDSVTTLIQDIADQTNLLALNAAIEAARAGPQGRGFAVVADEVRKLAERTAASTGDISRLVQGIQDGTAEVTQRMQVASQEAASGTAQGRHMKDMLGELDQEMLKVRALMDQIAVATDEQSAVSREMSGHMAETTRITEATQGQFAATHAAMADLLANAERLQASIGHFQLGRT